MTNEDATQDAPKTPLERVHEQQEHAAQTLAEGRAQSEGRSQTSDQQSEEPQPDATPEVPGAGTPSSMRTHPQRRNQSHGQ